MIVRIALLLVSIPLLAHGADGLFRALRSRTQAVVTCQQFLEARPSSNWVRITGCEVDYVNAAYRSTAGRITELFFPLRPPGAAPGEPAPIVVSTKDLSVRALADWAISGPGSVDEDVFVVTMLRIVTIMGAARVVEGATRSRVDILRTRGALSAVKAPLAENFTVIDAGERPRYISSAIEAFLGAQALLLFLLASLKARRQAAASPPTQARSVSEKHEHAPSRPASPAKNDEISQLGSREARLLGARERLLGRAPSEATDDATAGTGVAISSTTPEFLHLMLVKLPADAGSWALEDAPPLGEQTHVRASLNQILPGISFDDRGHGQFNGTDHTVRMNLGAMPQVWTATLDVTGPAAAAVLQRLIAETGWRAYAPKRGRFIGVEDFRNGA